MEGPPQSPIPGGGRRRIFSPREREEDLAPSPFEGQGPESEEEEPEGGGPDFANLLLEECSVEEGGVPLGAQEAAADGQEETYEVVRRVALLEGIDLPVFDPDSAGRLRNDVGHLAQACVVCADEETAGKLEAGRPLQPGAGGKAATRKEIGQARRAAERERLASIVIPSLAGCHAGWTANPQAAVPEEEDEDAWMALPGASPVVSRAPGDSVAVAGSSVADSASQPFLMAGARCAPPCPGRRRFCCMSDASCLLSVSVSTIPPSLPKSCPSLFPSSVTPVG